jgi:hypothetical protein
MGVVETSPVVPQRDGEAHSKQDGELTAIASNGPRRGGSTHGYTSWGAPNARGTSHARVTEASWNIADAGWNIHQLPGGGHPRRCVALCGEAGVSSVTLCRLPPYG